MNFVKPQDLKPKTTFSALLYGTTGIGKTTAALSAPNPAIIDFDGGINRVKGSFLSGALVAQVDSWDGWQNMVNALKDVPADTFIFDTVSKVLDMIQVYVLNKPVYKAKNLEKPSLQAFGDIKHEYCNFIRGMKLSGKNIIFVSQEVESTVQDIRGKDIRYHQPSCGSDKNRTELLQDLDLVGYMHKEDAETVIDFDPTSEHYGKNTCGIPAKVAFKQMEGAADNILFQWIHGLFVKRQEENIQKAPYYEQLNSLLKSVNAITTPDDATAFCKSMAGVKWLLDAKAKVVAAFQEKIASLNIVKEGNKYVQV